MKRIVVVDGMGGGMGKSLVSSIKERFPNEKLIACGTNGLATQAMLKAGADTGVTGENAIIYQANRCDVICGSFGIVVPNAMQGELSPRIAEALASLDTPKILLPVHKCSIELAAVSVPVSESMAVLLERLAEILGGSDS